MKSIEKIQSVSSSKKMILLNNQFSLEDSQVSETKSKIQSASKQNQLQLDQTDLFLMETRKKLQGSKNSLLNFHNKRQGLLNERTELEFSHISRQIRNAKQRLRNRNHKTIDASQIEPRDRKATDRNIQHKVKLLEGVLQERDFREFKDELNDKVVFLSKKHKSQPQLYRKISGYLICYEVLSKFLNHVCSQTSKISVKNEKQLAYEEIKREMIGILANETFFEQHYRYIMEGQRERDSNLVLKPKIVSGRPKPTTTVMFNKGKGLNGDSFNDKPLDEKIEELLELNKNHLKEAFHAFGKPHLKYEVELEFNKRFHSLNKSLLS